MSTQDHADFCVNLFFLQRSELTGTVDTSLNLLSAGQLNFLL